jgi:uncharacterized protein (DUF1501 family)
VQGSHFKDLFTLLCGIMEELDSRTSLSGAPLAEEVTVVVISEMGRDPRLNGAQGKNHWTYTSAMLVGAGIQGGQVIGEYNEDFIGDPVDLTTGEVSDTGSRLHAKHLGATLLALGDIDPAEHLGDVTAIEGALS